MTVLTEMRDRLKYASPVSCQNGALLGKQAGNEEGMKALPQLLPFMLPFPFIGIKILMSCDSDVFSRCPEAAILSAHKYLREWVSQSMKIDFLS